MPTWFGIVLVVIVLVIMVNVVNGLIPRRVRPRLESRKERAEELRSLATELGMSFDPEPPPAILDEELLKSQVFLDIQFCGEAARTSRFVRHLLQRQDEELTVRVMDYQQTWSYLYEAGGSERELTIAEFRTERLDLPQFRAALLPAGRFGNLFGRSALRHGANQEEHWKGWQFLDLGAEEPVASRYMVRTRDEEAVRRVLSETLLNHLAESTLSFEAMGDRVIFWRTETHVERGLLYYCSSYRMRLIPTEDMAGFLDECRELLRLLSRQVHV